MLRIRSAAPPLATALALACSKSPAVVTRAVTLHAPAACAPGASAYGVFRPLGDFPPLADVPSLPLADVGAELAGVPAETREVTVDVTDATDARWSAHGAVGPSGGVDLLVLPLGVPCAVTDTIDARTDAALGAIDATHVLVAGGSASAGGVPSTVVVDLSVGTVQKLASGLLVPRAKATVTSWAAGAVVAGGVRPDTGEAVASAEVYASAAGDFDGAPVALSEARARHGAALLVSGETLLVGGVDAGGAVLGSMEIVDPAAHRARTAGLPGAVKRADPTVLRLASGEVLVAGGVDASGAPVPTLEWFTADATAASKPSRPLVASTRRAFIALDAGGALAVIAPDGPSAGFQNVWVVSADGGLEPATAIDGALTDPHLFAGVDGSPILWTGDRWLVWQPWTGTFGAMPEALGAAGPSGDPALSPEAGLGVWIDGSAVRLLRSGARGPYAITPASLLATDTAFTAPDRLAVGPSPPASFDVTKGLSLDPGASVFVTDATYASFVLDAETPGKAPPAIVLRDDAGQETVLDASSCPVAAGATIHVERAGATVQVSVDGGALVSCTAAPSAAARVSIGVRGRGTQPSVVRAVAISRR